MAVAINPNVQIIDTDPRSPGYGKLTRDGFLLIQNLTTAINAAGPGSAAEPSTTTGGTAIGFTGIPANTNRVTLMINQVSLNGAIDILIQLGSAGAYQATGYISQSGGVTSAPSTFTGTSTAGFTTVVGGSGANIFAAVLVFTRVVGNTWMVSGTGLYTNITGLVMFAGFVTLSAALDRVRLVSADGVATFDANSGVSIFYE